MRVLISTKLTQGQRDSDYCFCNEDELVMFGFECDSDRNNIDGGCGCRRGMSGFDTHKGTTTFMVVDWSELTPDLYEQKFRQSLDSAGYLSSMSPTDVREMFAELVSVAESFEPYWVLEKRGDMIQARAYNPASSR